MDFAVLGPVRASLDGRPVPLRGKRSAVVSTLLLHPDVAVPRERIVAWLWDEPPKSAVANVQTYVSQLRRASVDIAPEGRAYRIPLDGHRLDLVEFEDAVRSARRAVTAGELDVAHSEFGRAFTLWRGRPAENAPLADAALPRIAELEERARSARAEWVEVRLHLGLHDEVISELTVLVEAEPLRERSWRQLMTALHHSGRRAEALQVYARARTTLVDELGVEPGPELRDLHLAILHDEEPTTFRALGPAEVRTWRPAEPSPSGPGCQLPPDIADFVGRERELTDIHAALRRKGSAPSIVVMSGPPGVGKTTVAVRAAHLARPEYPDGQLFVRLRGGEHDPRTPADLLGELLRLLGVDGAVIPASVAERAAMYRARMADRRVLVVLDDAADEEQIAPLLPGTSSTAVLVTSRTPLAALPGTTAVNVDLPDPDFAKALLARFVGRERVDSEPRSAEELLSSCGYLPLAIRVVAARLATRPGWPLSELSRRLRGARSRLDELRVGSLDVRSTFSAGYSALPDDARRAFRLFGLTGAESLAPWAFTASLTGSACPQRADRAMEALVDAGLVTAYERDGAGQLRYRMHALLRSYAQEHADAAHDPDNREDRTGLLRLAARAHARVVAASRQLPLPFAPPLPHHPPRSEPCLDDRLWSSAERATLLSLIEAVAPSALGTAVDLACDFTPHLVNDGFHDDAVRVLGTLVDKVSGTDPHAEARLRLVRADVEIDRGHVGVAGKEYRALLDSLRLHGEDHAAAYALTGLAACEVMSGALDVAGALSDEAAATFDAHGDAHGLLQAWLVRAGGLLQRGRHADAVTLCLRALSLPEARCGVHEAAFLRVLGIAWFESGSPRRSLPYYEESLRLSRELGWRKGERITLRRLGEARAALGEIDTAMALLEQCRAMFGEAGDVQGEALTAYSLGEAHRRRGDVRTALGHFVASVSLLGSQADPSWRARAAHAISRCRAALVGS
ncbi:AfsR/SARP family transcriptional regulator [Saccharomonospora cyanea]|uniref:DNA-binding transcriptional activator of the SARP family n=1 Tax=Saccharomonospora cyanea NA-134 TaxID=882082 RepID=H5XDI8_9PSEU|nr:BTAD domain-containing putative transcriptional regulator [Saccharomonospora cyanea]EHR60280.1 DNA-binding transcriptional activator of the SARP family [Saccharomonospora cyanea NA-134]